MIIQAISYGVAAEEPFAFTYSGDFTDERVDGIGDVTLNTSGTLVTSGQTVTVSVYILGGGGGGAQSRFATGDSASGGGGGNQTVEVELVPGIYEIVIGTGGTGLYNVVVTDAAGDGGDTTAFGVTSTGGTGSGAIPSITAGKGGTPNGGDGSTGKNTGGLPNGGASNGGSAAANSGGDGLVRITFS